MASKKSKNKKRLVLHDFDEYRNEQIKPEIVQVRKIKPHNFRLIPVSPLTSGQKLTFEAFESGDHLMLHGTAGTGKTYLSLYLILDELLNRRCFQDKIYIVRSIVPTREIGFLPGDQKEKTRVYEAPYQAVCNELFNRGDAYDILKQKNIIEFVSTSFVRGITLNDCYVLVDEFSNCNFHELDSVITRTGKNCRLIFSGDYTQSDIIRQKERQNILKFIDIIKGLEGISYIEFSKEDIVRSKLVSDYIIAREKHEIQPANLQTRKI